MTACKVENCSSPIYSRSTGLCNKHRLRLMRYGEPEGKPDKSWVKSRNLVCAVSGCEKPYRRNGLCAVHSAEEYSKTKFNYFLRSKLAVCRSAAKGRYFPAYKNLPVDDFSSVYEWSLNYTDAPELFHKWVNSGNAQNLTPCLVRVNTDKGYVVGNLRWIVFENLSDWILSSPYRVSA